MDQIIAQLAPALGAFLPAALLGWWVIRNQAETIKAKDQRIAVLTNALFKLAQSGQKTAAVALGIEPTLADTMAAVEPPAGG